MTNDADTPQMAHLIRLMQKAQPERNAEDIRADLHAVANKTPTYPDPMLPPWAAIPDIPGWPDIGWRMGGGEDYFGDFAKWFRALSEKDRAAYVAKNPEPNSHKGLCAVILKRD